MAVADFSRVNSNIGALNALNSLNNVNKQLGMNQLRLATGKRINSAADDPAGLTIATTFRQRNENLKVALGNIGDGKNLMSVAEGGLNKVQDLLLEMRNKAEAAASDTLGTSERDAIADQLSAFAAEIDDIVDQTTWNGKKLLDGLNASDWGAGRTITLQTGAEVGETTTLTNTEFGSVAVSAILSSYVSSASATATVNVVSYSESVAQAATDASFTSGTSSTMTAGLSELASGTYKVRINVTDNTSNTGGTIQLLDSAGNALTIDDGSGTQGLAQTVDLNATDPATYDFGNGLTIAFDPDDLNANGTVEFDVNYSRAGSTYTFNVSNATNASTVMTNLDTAIDTVSSRLQTIGTLTSRLSFKEENLAEAQINTEAAYNRIANADMAMSQLEATKYQILQQTATSMLAQANQAPQGLMQLFR